MLVEQLHQFGEIRQGPGQSVDFVDTTVSIRPARISPKSQWRSGRSEEAPDMSPSS